MITYSLESYLCYKVQKAGLISNFSAGFFFPIFAHIHTDTYIIYTYKYKLEK